MSRNERDFDVPVGETFHPTLRWGAGVYTAKVITAISKATPAVVTAAAHGLPNGWPCAVVGVSGMTQINATRYPPAGPDWKFGTVLDADNVQLEEVSSALFSTYVSGGALVYDTPTPLVGVNVSLVICSDPQFEDVLVTLASGVGITIDTTLMTITPLLQTAGLAWKTGYYLVKATDSGGIVTELLRGVISIQ